MNVRCGLALRSPMIDLGWRRTREMRHNEIRANLQASPTVYRAVRCFECLNLTRFHRTPESGSGLGGLEVQIFVDGGAFCEFQFGGLGYLMWQKQPGLADP